MSAIFPTADSTLLRNETAKWAKGNDVAAANRQNLPGATQDLSFDASWRSLKRRSRWIVALLQQLSEKCAQQAF
jgi:hypothetical protein